VVYVDIVIATAAHAVLQAAQPSAIKDEKLCQLQIQH
jgi:hypothetical protein